MGKVVLFGNIIQAELKACVDERCVVKNTRKKDDVWESGVVSSVSVNVWENAQTSLAYRVKLDRKNGDKDIVVLVTDAHIKKA